MVALPGQGQAQAGRGNFESRARGAHVTPLGVVRDPGTPIKRFDPPKKVTTPSGVSGAPGDPNTLVSLTTSPTEAAGGPGTSMTPKTWGWGALDTLEKADSSANPGSPATAGGKGTTGGSGVPSALTNVESSVESSVVAKILAKGNRPLFPHERAILNLMPPRKGAVQETDAAESAKPGAETIRPTDHVTEEKQTPTDKVANKNESVQETNVIKGGNTGTNTSISPNDSVKGTGEKHAAEESSGIQQTDLLGARSKTYVAEEWLSTTNVEKPPSTSGALIDLGDGTDAVSEKISTNSYMNDLMELSQMMSFTAQPLAIQPSAAEPSTTAQKCTPEQFSQPVLEFVDGFPGAKYISITLMAPEVAKFLSEINYSPPRGMERIRYATYLLVQWHLGPLDKYKALSGEEKQDATDIIFATSIRDGCRITRTAQDMLALRDLAFACPAEVEEFNEMVRTGNYNRRAKKSTGATSAGSTSGVTATTASGVDVVSRADLRECTNMAGARAPLYPIDDEDVFTMPAKVEKKPVVETANKGPLATVTNTVTTTAAAVAAAAPTARVEAEKKNQAAATENTRPLCAWDLL